MYAVTVSQKAGPGLIAKARRESERLALPYVKRQKQSIPSLLASGPYDALLVFTDQGPTIQSGEGPAHKFHLSMAQLRIDAMEKGRPEHLLRAVGDEVSSFLDCTLGLACDSLVFSYARPHCETIVGLEANPLLAYVTAQGCAHFVHEAPAVTAALRRIAVVQSRYEDYLHQQGDDSVDVVYLDPMFSTPVYSSPQFLGLRSLVEDSPLTAETLDEARRVARRRVVIKERPFSPLFESFVPTEMVGGRYSRIAYGVYKV